MATNRYLDQPRLAAALSSRAESVALRAFEHRDKVPGRTRDMGP